MFLNAEVIANPAQKRGAGRRTSRQIAVQLTAIHPEVARDGRDGWSIAAQQTQIRGQIRYDAI